MPSIHFFANNNILDKCPTLSHETKSAPWHKNSTTYDLVGSSRKVHDELSRYVISVLKPSSSSLEVPGPDQTQKESRLSSRTIPANLLEQSWEEISTSMQFKLKLSNADGSKQIIKLHELVRDRVLTYHHRAGLNFVLSEVTLFLNRN